MTGAPARLLTWLAVMATLLTACTPAVDVTETDAGPPIASSSVAPTPSDVVTVPTTTATQSAVAEPPAPPPPAPPAAPQAFAINLYQEGDFVPQYTFDWCVAASIQMAHNLIDDTGGGSWASSAQQSELWEMARARSSNSFNGETGRPVGLVMWSGRHAWVMSGFQSIGDPAQFPEFQVTGVHVLDPLYPYGSGQWGPSPEPNSLLSPEQLAAQFVVREPRRWSTDLPTGYLLVLPVTSA
jgi:hypothetical protein